MKRPYSRLTNPGAQGLGDWVVSVQWALGPLLHVMHYLLVVLRQLRGAVLGDSELIRQDIARLNMRSE